MGVGHQQSAKGGARFRRIGGATETKPPITSVDI